MDAQSTNAVLLVRPACFGFNAEAARTNAFAHAPVDEDMQRKALTEFDAVTEALAAAGVDVVVFDDTLEPPKPDAVFPNNWVSFHSDGTMVLYPMATAPRRLERRAEDVRALVEDRGFEVSRIVDLSGHERQSRFLEGTGSMVLDRANRRAFANRSPRTSVEGLAQFTGQLGYESVLFDAFDRSGRPIYHTNVLLSLGTRFAVICADAIAPCDQRRVLEQIEASGRTIIETSFEQLRQFGCNVLELQGKDGPVIAMSARALGAFGPDQLKALETFADIAAAEIPTIEAVGGGSVRCMIAEVHLPRVRGS